MGGQNGYIIIVCFIIFIANNTVSLEFTGSACITRKANKIRPRSVSHCLKIMLNVCKTGDKNCRR